MASGSGAGGTGSECEGEEQEDSSSSNDLDVTNVLRNLNIQDNTQNNITEDELSAFRQQWQRELESTPTPQREQTFQQEEPMEPLSDEDKAKQLFLRGVELERGGKLYEAIQHYKRAMQIVPDIETRLYESSDLRADTPEGASEAEEEPRTDDLHPSDDEDAVEGEDLLARLQRIMAKKGYLCEPEVPTKSAHMSWLPYEVIMVILRWVVSAELDAGSLERVAAVCRGLYVAAREPDIWRSLCVRFFPEGLVLMWTTAEEPVSSVAALKYRATKPGLGIMSGHYRLMGDKVVIVIKKCNSEKKQAQASNTRFRARHKQVEHQEQTFHMELELRTVRSRRNFQLVWRRYAVCARRDQWTTFELNNSKFPPFVFSRVRNYAAEAHAPLLSTCAYA